MKTNHRMKEVLTSIITILTITGAQAQTLPRSPKLVVGITIENLRTDYIEAYASLFGETGFKRIWKEGCVFTQSHYPFAEVDRSSAQASIYTGTTPSLHGIVANQWLEAASLRLIASVEDRRYTGHSTEQSYAPTQLLTSTLSDELKDATQGQGMVYAIAPQGDAAILSAGHKGDAAIWLNPHTGKWCGSSFYGSLPHWVDHYNRRKSPDFRIESLSWQPLYSLSLYKTLPNQRDLLFKHRFSDDAINQYHHLAHSPLINDEVTLLAEEAIKQTGLGVDEVTDLLALTYYAGPYTPSKSTVSHIEQQDTYIRLDRNIGELLTLLDKRIGLQNVLIFITSTGHKDLLPSTHEKDSRLAENEFDLNRCISLLNMYLTATYGNGKYIESHYKNQLFLNHKLIEQKRISVAEMQDKCTAFLLQCSGVNEVYSSQRIALGAWSPELEKIKNGYHRKRSGDLLLDILPGWTLIDEQTREKQISRYPMAPIPMMFMGYSLKPSIVQHPVGIEQLAPYAILHHSDTGPKCLKGSASTTSTLSK